MHGAGQANPMSYTPSTFLMPSSGAPSRSQGPGHEGHDHDSHEGHDDHSGHGHEGHDHAHDLRGTSKRSLVTALALISTYMVAEVVGGILSGSLALLADAGHMLTDAASIVMALVAMWIGGKAASAERTFGYYRTEVLVVLPHSLYQL